MSGRGKPEPDNPKLSDTIERFKGPDINAVIDEYGCGDDVAIESVLADHFGLNSICQYKRHAVFVSAPNLIGNRSKYNTSNVHNCGSSLALRSNSQANLASF